MNTLVYLAFFFLIFFIPFWPDPDGIGIFNAICLNAEITEVPFLSAEALHSIPCSVLAWKVFHFIWLGVILFLLRKHYSLSLLGLVGFVPVFLLTLEDDLLAFPFLFLYFVWAQKNQIDLESLRPMLLNPLHSQWFGDLYQRIRWENVSEYFRYRLPLVIVGVILTLFLGLFVWKGSFLIGLILLTYYVYPPFSLISIAWFFIFNANVFDNWSGSAEVVWGSGFIIGQLGLFFLLVDYWKNGFKWNDLFWLVISFEILLFFQPKWGEWIILPLLPLLHERFSGNKLVKIISAWLLILIVSFTIFTSFPSQSQLLMFEEAVIIQKSGELVYNDWGVGHIFEYYGGKPSAKGGFHGEKYPDNNFYWFGPQRNNCLVIRSIDSLFLQKC